MSRFRLFRRAARATCVALAAVLPAALAPSPARAQPACEAGTLAAYLAPGFACRIDGWAFEEFNYFTVTDASPGVSTFVPDAEFFDVLPFRRVEPDGRVAFGFEFLDLGSSVSTTGSARGDERGTAVAQVEFLGRALTPAAPLLGARADLTAVVDGTSPATSFVSAQSFALVGGLFAADRCLDATTASAGSGFTHDEHVGACTGGPVHEVFAQVGAIARLDRDGDDRPATLFGFAAGSAQRVTFVTAQVVPEPSTVVLAAAGLLGLAAAARRRGAP